MPFKTITDIYSGPGIGFYFDNSTATSKGMEVVTNDLPDCLIGPLDAVYFYVYGCKVETSAVLHLTNLPGFQYTTDKSLTLAEPSGQTSLLIANYWNLTLQYDNATSCSSDAAYIAKSEGCVSVSSCGCEDGSNSSSVTLGCGSVTCEGCVVEDFFNRLGFTQGSFDTDVFIAGGRALGSTE